MKYIIFGTGKYSLKYCQYIDDEKIICFIDNDELKVGKKFNGKFIYTPQRIFQENFDYVIVFVKNYSAIVDQLLQLNVPKEKIITYHRIYDIEPIPQRLIAKKNEDSILQWVESRTGKKIFICSHDFTRTGVPVALMNLTLLLKKMGYQVLLAAVGNGSLEEELCKNEIDFISDIEVLYSSKRFIDQLKGFDIIILGTLAIAEVGKAFSRLSIPIMWWLHESDEYFFKRFKLPVNHVNIHYYGGGNRVIRRFNQFYPEESVKELLYFLPDIQIQSHDYLEERVFAIIGSFTKRKAQDILISAIKELPEDIIRKCVFYFIGVSGDEDRKMMEELCQEFTQIRYIYEMNQKDLAEFYRKIDVLICPSRDDPMPIVVTQAMQNGIPCIVSSQVGQCEYIEKIGGGAVFPSENIFALKQQITEFVLCSAEEMEKCSKSARKVFDLYFSEELMEQNLIKIFSELSV